MAADRHVRILLSLIDYPVQLNLIMWTSSMRKGDARNAALRILILAAALRR